MRHSKLTLTAFSQQNIPSQLGPADEVIRRISDI